jgi:hypothetical protein
MESYTQTKTWPRPRPLEQQMSQDPQARARERTWQPEAAVAPLAAHQAQPYQQAAYPVQAQQPANGMAVASLVLGITSLVFCW